MAGAYEAAQICLNGHLINQFAMTQPERNQEFCAKCGSRTISECLQCNFMIRGQHHSRRARVLYTIKPPAFCYHCGKAHPWTERRLSAAQDLVKEVEKLDDNERRVLSESLDDLIRETPNTPTAVIRFKRLAAKAGSSTVEALRSLLVDVLSEAVRKQIWPS